MWRQNSVISDRKNTAGPRLRLRGNASLRPVAAGDPSNGPPRGLSPAPVPARTSGMMLGKLLPLWGSRAPSPTGPENTSTWRRSSVTASLVLWWLLATFVPSGGARWGPVGEWWWSGTGRLGEGGGAGHSHRAPCLQRESLGAELLQASANVRCPEMRVFGGVDEPPTETCWPCLRAPVEEAPLGGQRGARGLEMKLLPRTLKWVPGGPVWPLRMPSVLSSHRSGCAWGLGRTSREGLRSWPLPCPDGPGPTLSAAGEDNGPFFWPVAHGHILQGPSDPEQGLWRGPCWLSEMSTR